MDLTLLQHLSDKALREEAERRGIDHGALDRDGLLEAIRADQARADAPVAAAVQPIKAAKRLIGKVVSFARDALTPKSAPPAAATEAAEREPIRTRTMAALLEKQGHFERALSIVDELARHGDDAELREWRERLRDAIDEAAAREHATRRLATERGSFVELLVGGGVVWSIDDTGLARARALIGPAGAPTLRVVRVVAFPDRSVEVLTEDRAVDTRGWARSELADGERRVVAIGLRDGERFVSIAHAAS